MPMTSGPKRKWGNLTLTDAGTNTDELGRWWAWGLPSTFNPADENRSRVVVAGPYETQREAEAALDEHAPVTLSFDG